MISRIQFYIILRLLKYKSLKKDAVEFGMSFLFLKRFCVINNAQRLRSKKRRKQCNITVL